MAHPEGRVRGGTATPLGPDADGRRRGVARARRPSGRAHAHLRARHAPRPDAREHSRRALPSHEAVRGRRARPGSAPLDAPRVGASRGQDARHPRARSDRPGGGAQGGGARADGDRDPARAGARPPRDASRPARGHRRDSRRVGLRAPAPARDAGDARSDGRAAARADASDGVAPQLRAGRAGRRRGSGRRGQAPHDRTARSSTSSGSSPCPTIIRSGRRPASPCCRTSAGSTPPATSRWPRSSWTTSGGSSTASRSATSSTGRAATDRRSRPATAVNVLSIQSSVVYGRVGKSRRGARRWSGSATTSGRWTPSPSRTIPRTARSAAGSCPPPRCATSSRASRRAACWRAATRSCPAISATRRPARWSRMRSRAVRRRQSPHALLLRSGHRRGRARRVRPRRDRRRRSAIDWSRWPTSSRRTRSSWSSSPASRPRLSRPPRPPRGPSSAAGPAWSSPPGSSCRRRPASLPCWRLTRDEAWLVRHSASGRARLGHGRRLRRAVPRRLPRPRRDARAALEHAVAALDGVLAVAETDRRGRAAAGRRPGVARPSTGSLRRGVGRVIAT